MVPLFFIQNQCNKHKNSTNKWKVSYRKLLFIFYYVSVGREEACISSLNYVRGDMEAEKLNAKHTLLGRCQAKAMKATVENTGCPY